MRPLTETVPKSMLDVADEPFIAHQLRLFRRRGVRQVVICVGFLGSVIQDFVGDGARFDLSVSYSFDGETLLGTGGALRKAKAQLGDTMMVVYGDSWLDADYAAVVEAFRASGKRALMTVFHNENAFDTSNVEFDGTIIRRYDKRVRTSQMHFIDWGMGVVSAGAFGDWVDVERFDLADLYAGLVEKGELAGYEIKQRFYEIGSTAGLAETDALLRSVEPA